jgi:CRP/FNR family cyclic AMP-dependent transcriptional regulator
VRKGLVFLGILDDRDVDWLVANGKRKDVPSAEILIRQGQPVEFLYFVLDGIFDVTVSSPNERQRQVAKLYAGELVGEMSFVDSRPPSATVSAAMNASVLAITRSDLAEKIEDDIGFAARFYKGIAVFLSDRLRAADNLGFGDVLDLREDVEDKDELAPHLMDTLAMAGMRFEKLQRSLELQWRPHGG